MCTYQLILCNHSQLNSSLYGYRRVTLWVKSVINIPIPDFRRSSQQLQNSVYFQSKKYSSAITIAIDSMDWLHKKSYNCHIVVIIIISISVIIQQSIIIDILSLLLLLLSLLLLFLIIKINLWIVIIVILSYFAILTYLAC